jgi:hypothetical protein
MDENDYNKKYRALRILKSIQDYSKPGYEPPTSVYPIKIPRDFLLQTLRIHGPKDSDSLIHSIFKLGLNLWSEALYQNTFGSTDSLQKFIDMVKNKEKI